MADGHVDVIPPGKDGNNTEDSFMVLRRYKDQETEVDVYTGPEARQLWRRLGAHFDSFDADGGDDAS